MYSVIIFTPHNVSKELEGITKSLEEKTEMLEALLKSVPGTQDDLLHMQKLLSENKEKWSSFDKISKEIEEGTAKISTLRRSLDE